tara:strand:- start:154 stop:384 length:231 start_codon:yes stop_codon:yes gene_type:complete
LELFEENPVGISLRLPPIDGYKSLIGRLQVGGSTKQKFLPTREARRIFRGQEKRDQIGKVIAMQMAKEKSFNFLII